MGTSPGTTPPLTHLYNAELTKQALLLQTSHIVLHTDKIQRCLSFRNEQAATLYQNLSLTEPRLIPQLENVFMNFIKEIKQQNSEMENLALAIKR